MVAGRSAVRSRVLMVAGAALVLAAIGVGYTAYAMNRPSAGSAPVAGDATPAEHPGLYVRDAGGSIVVQSPDAKAGKGGEAPDRVGTGLNCARFYAEGGTAVCLTTRLGVKPMTSAIILDDHLEQQQRFEFGGVPSRARVSGEGRFVSWTVFVTGDEYATTDFSTRTGFYDLEQDFLVKSVEDLGLYIDGRLRAPEDVNYWGLTFADDQNTFYVTVSTGGETYLAQGDLASWTAHTLRKNVECPSLSPDGTRIAFKKRVDPGVESPWRLYVLDLATMKETAVAEDRSVDDQAAWLDDDTLAYAVDDGVWSVPSDGTGAPSLLAPGASSPAMVRP